MFARPEAPRLPEALQFLLSLDPESLKSRLKRGCFKIETFDGVKRG